jgi:hypothetical protein
MLCNVDFQAAYVPVNTKNIIPPQYTDNRCVTTYHESKVNGGVIYTLKNCLKYSYISTNERCFYKDDEICPNALKLYLNSIAQQVDTL